jgi:hypothetical protein
VSAQHILSLSQSISAIRVAIPGIRSQEALKKPALNAFNDCKRLANFIKTQPLNIFLQGIRKTPSDGQSSAEETHFILMIPKWAECS